MRKESGIATFDNSVNVFSNKLLSLSHAVLQLY